MAQSTLIVGIGTTGLRIIEEAQQFHYEFTGRNKPNDRVQYIYLETDVDMKPQKTAAGKSDIELVPLGLSDNKTEINKLKNNNKIDSSWIPESTEVLANEKGAGGMPSYGRLSLWIPKNLDNFYSTVANKYQLIQGDGNTNIIVVGSLTGGTGSGIVVDVAYFLQDITSNNNINGIFLLPNRLSFGTNDSIFENAFTSLTAIDYYSKANNEYSVTLPNSKKITKQGPPFQLVTHLSHDFADSRAPIASLSELIKVAGSITGLYILGTDAINSNYFDDIIERRRKDAKGQSKMNHFISAGFYMIQFPKAQLEELLFINISSSKIRELINPDRYFHKTRKKQEEIKSVQSNLENEARTKLNDLVDKAIEQFDSIHISNKAITDEIVSSIAENANKGKEEISQTLTALFASDRKGNVYEYVVNYQSSLYDNFIIGIDAYVSEIIESNQNLQVVRIALEEFIKHSKNLISFYKTQYKLEGKSEEWNGILSKNIGNYLSNDPNSKIFLKQKEYYIYVVKEIYTLLRINTLIPILNKLSEELNNPQSIVKSKENIYLPSIKAIKEVIEYIARALDAEKLDGEISFNERKLQIENALGSFTSSYKTVYLKGSLEADIKAANDLYNRDFSTTIELKGLFGTDNIWRFLTQKKKDLYNHCLGSALMLLKNKRVFEKLVDVEKVTLSQIITDLKLQGDKDVKRLFDVTTERITNEIPAMVRLADGKYSFESDSHSRLIFVSNNNDDYAPLFSMHKLDDKDSVCNIPSLANAVIFYKDYGYTGHSGDTNAKEQSDVFVPLMHLAYISDLKDKMKDKINSKDFIVKKSPYLTKDQLLKYIQ